MGDRRRPVLIYRETLLAPSEPFITAQGESLRRHEPWYLSVRSVDGHPIPAARDLRWSSSSALAPVRRYAWKRWGWAPRTTSAIRRLDPVVVHAHFGRDAAQLLPMLRRVRRPLVVTFHGHDALRSVDSLRTGSYSDRLYLDRFDAIGRTGARFLAVSTVVHDRLLERGLPASRVEQHYIGVDTEAIARSSSGPREDDLVVFVGRLVPQKGAAELIEAVARTAMLGAPLRLVLLGAGPERRALERLAAERGVSARFLGPQPQAAVWAWMHRASVVAVPSKTGSDGWKEAFGLVAAEAQAAGARAVASTCGGLPEAIAPANEELLFPEADVEALADRLVHAVSGDERARVDARGWVEACRSLRLQSARLDAIYEEVAP